MPQAQKYFPVNRVWLPLIVAVSLTSISATNCSVGPDSRWVLEEATIVALEVRRVGSSVVLAGDPFSPVNDTLTIERGAQLRLTASSLGSSSCRRGELYESDTVANELTITLIDSVLTGPEIACTDDLSPLSRDILHTLNVVGTSAVIVTGNPDSRVTFNVIP